MAETAAGVVITFFPDEGFASRLAAIAREVSPLFVVDNTTDDGARETVRRTAEAAGAVWRPQEGNRGTAGALNAAFAELAAAGHATAIAFDQDSVPAAGCVAALQESARAPRRIAVVGSNWRDAGRPGESSRHLVDATGFRPWFRRVAAGDGRDLDDVAFVIASGSLFDLMAWRELGGFRDALFLDLVDTEYCLRAAAAGWRIRVAARAGLEHRRGAKRPVRRFGRVWWPAFMPPGRIRLITRNRVHLLLRWGWTRWPWALFELTHEGFMLFSALALEDDRAARLAAFFGGAVSGLCGRLGPPPA